MPTTAVTGQTTFGANTSGTTTQLDNNFLLAYNALNNFQQPSNYLVDSGAANAYVVTAPANTTLALAAGLPLQVKAIAANTGASTLNANATGVKSILNSDGSPLGAGQIQANGIFSVMYDGTQYLLMNQFSRGYNLIKTVNAAASATVDITGLTTAYTQYMITMTDVIPATDGANLLLRISQAASFKSGANDYAYSIFGYFSSPAYFQSATTGTSMLISQGLSNTSTSKNYAGEFKIYNPGGAVRIKMCTWEATFTDNGATFDALRGGGYFTATSSGTAAGAIDAVQFLMSAGNITSGVFSLYGLAK